MGGSAFTSGTSQIYTPRMPREVYEQVRDQCHKTLREYYTQVGTPIQAPKVDYGDVDILVADPKIVVETEELVRVLSKALNAEHSKFQKGNPTLNFALPWPNDSLNSEPKRFVQVDVHVCDGQAGWDWEMFHQAHGDLWNLLGSTIRKHGLTINNVGLFLRIEEIELIDRKRSMILLTEKPSEILEFLGLDEPTFWKPFNDIQQLFEFAAGCRLFWVGDQVETVEEDKKKLKHNDRKRLAQRPVFRKWIEEFIPASRGNGDYPSERPSRDKVTEEAFDRFDVKVLYDQKLEGFRREKQVDELRIIIKGAVPIEDIEPVLRSASIRVLEAIVLDGKIIEPITPSKPLKKEDGFYDIEVVTEFINSSWKQAGEIGLARRAQEKMDKKAGNSASDVALM